MKERLSAIKYIDDLFNDAEWIKWLEELEASLRMPCVYDMVDNMEESFEWKIAPDHLTLDSHDRLPLTVPFALYYCKTKLSDMGLSYRDRSLNK